MTVIPEGFERETLSAKGWRRHRSPKTGRTTFDGPDSSVIQFGGNADEAADWAKLAAILEDDEPTEEPERKPCTCGADAGQDHSMGCASRTPTGWDKAETSTEDDLEEALRAYRRNPSEENGAAVTAAAIAAEAEEAPSREDLADAFRLLRAAVWIAQNDYAHASPSSPFVPVLEATRKIAEALGRGPCSVCKAEPPKHEEGCPNA